MFFSISTEKFDNRFFVHHKISNYYIALDAGWQQVNINGKEIFYKGYCDAQDMNAVAADFAVDSTPRYTGNFGIIVVDKDSLTLSHDIPRSFPLNVDHNGFLTNLTTKNSVQPIWADRCVIYNQKNIKILKVNNFNDLDLNFDEILTLDECADRIKKIIDDKLDFVKHSSVNKRIFLTGGVDTTLLYAIAQSKLENVEVVNYEHLDYNKFLLKNYNHLKKEYAIYRQLQCWREQSMLFSGAPGDEFFLRGPFMSGLWCSWNNFNLIELLDSNHDCYHRKFYLRDNVKSVIDDHYNNQQNLKSTYRSYRELCLHILNNCANDHQVWHLNNTLTWTPFKDLKILATVLKLNKADLLEQIIDATLSKRVISLYDADSLNLMDQYKNEDNFDNLLSDPKIGKLFE
jgi:asparagine synthetase B (glutamine-hydrolysing)